MPTAAPVATPTPSPTPAPTPAPTPTATPTPTPAPTTFRYDRLDATGAVATAGSYAFLTADGAPVTTYEGLRDGSTAGLRIHETDADGASRAAFYGAVATGDVFEWREHETCWVRYQVTSASPAVAGAKQLGVRWVTYSVTGCGTGAIPAADTVRTYQWSPPDIQSPSITAPVRHGAWEVMPYGWKGPVEPQDETPPPLQGAAGDQDAQSGRTLVVTGDLSVARKHPLWSDPVLPKGWSLGEAKLGIDGMYGYWAGYRDTEGYFVADIQIGRPDYLPILRVVWPDSRTKITELRIIDGHPALVCYSPYGASISTEAVLHNRETGVQYQVIGRDGFLRGKAIDRTIAIMRSLYRQGTN